MSDSADKKHPSRVRRWIIAILILIPITYLGIEIRWAYTAEPKPIDITDDLAALRAEYAPDRENAWDVIVDAVAMVDEIGAQQHCAARGF